jgi:hypothetical protein
MVRRGLLLIVHRAGAIELPRVRYRPPNPFTRRAPPAPMLIDTTPLSGSQSRTRPVELQQIRRTADEPLFNSFYRKHDHVGQFANVQNSEALFQAYCVCANLELG